ncbi:DUF1080 domain-containing protein [Tellurirhabdus bombi]|uniref:DUF1080 domain-containing protein n=1 Tax=Tellurirhabdus bombi TaxID=2907205 RepID=UPI001F466612|nr:DUF1080 domain-containing protein [Tellurirhabdus bombi]
MQIYSKNRMAGICLLAAFLALTTTAKGQPEKIIQPRLADMVEGKGLRVVNRAVSPLREKNRQGLRFDERKEHGIAWLEGVRFGNGTIELDIRGRDELQKSFVGIAFHGVDDQTFETIYFRPFNFQALDSIRRIHAVQYTFEPGASWEKLRKEHPGQYEKSVNPAPGPTDWFHARIEINMPTIRVFVNNAPQPSLVVESLSSHREGALGLMVGNQSNGDFANLKIMPAR